MDGFFWQAFGDPSANMLLLTLKLQHYCQLTTKLKEGFRCGVLFDSMKDFDSASQPTAASALARFEEICMALKLEDHLATCWLDDKLILPIKYSQLHIK